MQNPGISIVGYSQPDRFYPIYIKLKERRDGAVDRMLIYQPMPKRLTSGETKSFIKKLNQSPVKDLRQDSWKAIASVGPMRIFTFPLTLMLPWGGGRLSLKFTDLVKM